MKDEENQQFKIYMSVGVTTDQKQNKQSFQP